MLELMPFDRFSLGRWRRSLRLRYLPEIGQLALSRRLLCHRLRRRTGRFCPALPAPSHQSGSSVMRPNWPLVVCSLKSRNTKSQLPYLQASAWRLTSQLPSTMIERAVRAPRLQGRIKNRRISGHWASQRTPQRLPPRSIAHRGRRLRTGLRFASSRSCRTPARCLCVRHSWHWDRSRRRG